MAVQERKGRNLQSEEIAKVRFLASRKMLLAFSALPPSLAIVLEWLLLYFIVGLLAFARKLRSVPKQMKLSMNY